MKNIPTLYILFYFISFSLLAQDPVEKVVVVKGCEQLQENPKLKDCMYKALTSSLQERGFLNTLSKNLNPGLNKLRIYYKITAEKEVKLTAINTTNSKVEKLILRQIKKVKIIEPGTLKGKAIDVLYNLPLTLKVNVSGSVPIHKMSRLVYIYDKSNAQKLIPSVEHCFTADKKESKAKCMNTYMVDGTFNSIDSSKINSMLEDGLNTIKIKITHNENNEVLNVIPSSGNLKLDVILKNTINALLEKSKFRSPYDGEKSYAGEMLMKLNYFKT